MKHRTLASSSRRKKGWRFIAKIAIFLAIVALILTALAGKALAGYTELLPEERSYSYDSPLDIPAELPDDCGWLEFPANIEIFTSTHVTKTICSFGCTELGLKFTVIVNPHVELLSKECREAGYKLVAVLSESLNSKSCMISVMCFNPAEQPDIVINIDRYDDGISLGVRMYNAVFQFCLSSRKTVDGLRQSNYYSVEDYDFWGLFGSGYYDCVFNARYIGSSQGHPEDNKVFSECIEYLHRYQEYWLENGGKRTGCTNCAHYGSCDCAYLSHAHCGCTDGCCGHLDQASCGRADGCCDCPAHGEPRDEIAKFGAHPMQTRNTRFVNCLG